MSRGRGPRPPCRRSYAARGALLAASAALAACSSAATPAATAAAATAGAVAAPSEVERFLPLEHDTVFSYRVLLEGSAEPGLLILQVERRSRERASLRSGNSIKRLELAPDGVRLASGGYLLKAPLAPAASWAGPLGRVEVTAMDQTVSVEAGRFAGCIETTEAARADARNVVTTFCPGVGIVRFSVDDGERMERFELRSFGPKVDIHAL